MTPQELKNSILQLAIQGKLVEQRPEEGTAEALYQQIQQEKQKLIREGKIKKEKPLPEITEDEKPFEIPESWQWVRWGSLSESIQYGYNAPALESGRIRMVRISDIQNDKVCWETVPYCNIQESDISAYLLKENDILFARTGGTVGKSFLVKDVPCNAIYAGYLIRTRYSTMLSPEYMKYFMGSQLYWNQLKNGTISTAQPNCNGNTLSKMIVPLPPLAEQHRIVAKIEELLPLIDRYEKAWNRLEEFNKRFPEDLQKSLLQLAIQGKLVEQRPEEGTGEELYRKIQDEKTQLTNSGEVYRDKKTAIIIEDDIPFEIPDSWYWCRLGDLTKMITKGSSPAWQGISYTDENNGVLFITSENVGNNVMLMSKKKYVEQQFNVMHPASVLHKGDILTNLVGASIGRTAVFDVDYPNANINQAVCIVRLVENQVSDYLLKFLGSKSAVCSMLKDSVETARANLSLGAVTNLMIPLPPLAEQHRIVAKLEGLLPLCEKLK